MKTIREIALTPYYPYGRNKENIIAERIFEVDEALDRREECIRADEREMVLKKVENGLTKLMIMAEENNNLSFSRGHYDLVFTVLADFLDISETRIEEKWKRLKEQK